MDIRPLLRDSDARGALFYLMSYFSKTESTMDALLNILAPVVERIKDETNGAAEKVIAAALVRSCSCKTVAHMTLGGPAAASKVLGYSDSKSSSDAVDCAVWPLLKGASAAFGNPASPPASAGNADDEEQGAQPDNHDHSDDDHDAGSDVFISGATGKLRVSTCMHHLYYRRCDKDDTDHPYYNMCFVVWTRLVRVETPKAGAKASKTTSADELDDGMDDEEPDGEDIENCNDTSAPAAAAKKPGRKLSDRHEFVGLPKMKKQQV